MKDFPLDMPGLNRALRAWEHTYNTIRPHQALGYLTPEQFYQNWLNSHPGKEEVLSDMS